MSNSKFFDAKENCSNEIGDSSDVQNQGLVNNQISNSYQSNQSVDGGITFPLGNPTNGVPFPSMNNQLQMSVEPESAVINVENKSLNAALKKKEIYDECKRLKNANTSLENENVSLKKQCSWMKNSLKRHKKSLVYLKNKHKGLTGMVMGLLMELMESNAQLHERNRELEASNAQLLERNAQLENESNAREVNKENEHELDQAKN